MSELRTEPPRRLVSGRELLLANDTRVVIGDDILERFERLSYATSIPSALYARCEKELFQFLKKIK